MKIIGIVGSPKGAKSFTHRLASALLKGAQTAGAETELVDLCALSIGYCTACGQCYVKGVCPQKDDYSKLLQKMLESDGIVWGSPDYFGSVSAQMKTMIDRMADVIHCQCFLGKYACTAATSGSNEFAEVTEYLSRILTRLGANVVGSIGAQANGVDKMLDEAASLGGALAEAIKTKREFPEQKAIHTAMHERFKFLVSMNKDNWLHEYQYWQKMGWL